MAELGLLEDLSGSDLLAEVAVLHRTREEAGCGSCVPRINATVTHLAAVLRRGGHPGTNDERRVLAMLLMANPTEAVRVLAEHAHHAGGREPKPESEPILDIKKLLPTVWLFVHLVVDARTGEVGDLARVEGHGPISAEWAMRHLGSRARFKITAVIDPLHQAPVEAYEVPERHRHAVHLLTRADVFPYATNISRHKQIDHTVAFDHRPGAPPGQSRICNYGPMAPPITASRRTAGGTSSNPFLASTCGATGAGRPGWWTAPAPADWPTRRREPSRDQRRPIARTRARSRRWHTAMGTTAQWVRPGLP